MAYKGAIPKDIKDQIISRIKNDGIPATQAAKEHGVSPKTVYGWLGWLARSQPGILTAGKLKRENDALYEMIGRLTVKLNNREKKTIHS